jgi:osmoprotectant transport system ATP-binding protein
MRNRVLASDSKAPTSLRPFTIEFVGVTKCFGSLVALERTDLAFEAGRTTVLIGPSGCGKSTILRLIVGLLRPTAGLVRFEDRILSSETVLSLRRRMGYVIQEGGLFPHLTARQNILLLAEHLRQRQEEMQARLAELCEMTRLESVALSRYPLELSGGQRQRVCLIRALMMRPDVLLLDEPLAALDPMVRATLQMELKTIFRQICQTVVFVTHDLAEAAWLGDQIVLMREGRVVQSGTFDALVKQPSTSFVSEFINAQRKLALV